MDLGHMNDRVKQTVDYVDRYTAERSDVVFYLFVAIICLISIRYAIWCIVDQTYVGEVVTYYFPYGDAILNGVFPYIPYEELRWEYPPLSYIFMVIPRLFTSNVATYEVLYSFQVMFVLLIGLVLIRKFAKMYDKNPFFGMLGYAVSVYLLDYFIFDRFDIMVAVISMAAVYFFVQRRYTWATVLLVFGLFIKLYPALLLPIFLIPFISKGDYRTPLKQFLVFSILSVILIAPFIIIAPDTVWTFMSYHGDRGLQIESVAASFVLLAEIFGLTQTFTNNSFGSFNIGGGCADDVAAIMMPVMFIAIVAVYVLFFIQCRRTSDEDCTRSVVMASFIVVMMFVALNKVFSAQYVIWVMMLMIPAYYAIRPKYRSYPIIACVVLMFMTMWMVHSYDSLLDHDAYGIIVLLLRNLLFVAMTLIAIRDSGICSRKMQSGSFDGCRSNS